MIVNNVLGITNNIIYKYIRDAGKIKMIDLRIVLRQYHNITKSQIETFIISNKNIVMENGFVMTKKYYSEIELGKNLTKEVKL